MANESTVVPTVLSRAGAAELSLDPFPHVVLIDAIDPSFCQQLIAEFPPTTTVCAAGWEETAGMTQHGESAVALLRPVGVPSAKSTALSLES